MERRPTHTDAQELISDLILPFYDTNRDMLVPTKPEGKRRVENDAEHSWSVGVLACSLARHIDPNLDIGLVSQFATVHDLTELYAGDTSAWADSAMLETKEDREADALEKIKIKFAHFPWLVETLEAYERQDTQEALFVRSIDKYIAVCIRFMGAGEFFQKNKITKEKYDETLVSHREKAHGHPGAAEYYEMIRTEFDLHPEYFYSS